MTKSSVANLFCWEKKLAISQWLYQLSASPHTKNKSPRNPSKSLVKISSVRVAVTKVGIKETEWLVLVLLFAVVLVLFVLLQLLPVSADHHPILSITQSFSHPSPTHCLKIRNKICNLQKSSLPEFWIQNIATHNILATDQIKSPSSDFSVSKSFQRWNWPLESG